MRAIHILMGLVLSAVVGFGQDTPSQQRYRALLAEEREKVKDFADQPLVAELGDNFFYRREAAQQVLISRGFKAAPAALDGLWSPDPEIARRCENVLKEGRKETWKLLKLSGPDHVKGVAENSRYWAGTNPHRGGVEEMSLDSNVRIESPWPVVSVKSPIRVIAALSTAPEFIAPQTWCVSSSDEHGKRSISPALFLLKPTAPASRIVVIAEVEMKVRLAEEIRIPIKAGAEVVTQKDITVAKVTRVTASEKETREVVVSVHDYAGRLSNALVVPLKANGEPVAAPILELRSAFRSVFTVTVDQEVTILSIKLQHGPVGDKKVQALIVVTPP